MTSFCLQVSNWATKDVALICTSALFIRVFHISTFFISRIGVLSIADHSADYSTDFFSEFLEVIFVDFLAGTFWPPAEISQIFDFFKLSHTTYQSTQNFTLISKMYNFLCLSCGFLSYGRKRPVFSKFWGNGPFSVFEWPKLEKSAR